MFCWSLCWVLLLQLCNEPFQFFLLGGCDAKYPKVGACTTGLEGTWSVGSRSMLFQQSLNHSQSHQNCSHLKGFLCCTYSLCFKDNQFLTYWRFGPLEIPPQLLSTTKNWFRTMLRFKNNIKIGKRNANHSVYFRLPCSLLGRCLGALIS
jgi:hypothetical protein